MIIFRYIKGKIRPIEVQEEQTTSEYMNGKIRNSSSKMTLKKYIEKKEQEQQPLLQEFGYRPKEEKFRYTAQRLLEKSKKKK